MRYTGRTSDCTVLNLSGLGRHRAGILRVAWKNVHPHRTPFFSADQAQDDLFVPAFAIAVVAKGDLLALANALCSKALSNLQADNQPGYPEVYTNLHRAINLDPNFARPYVGLLEFVGRENMPGVNYPPDENARTITTVGDIAKPESIKSFNSPQAGAFLFR